MQSSLAAGYSSIPGHLLSSFTFKQRIVRPAHKLLVFAGCNLFHAAFVYTFASHSSFIRLIAAVATMNFVGAYGGAGSANMAIYCMGPVSQR